MANMEMKQEKESTSYLNVEFFQAAIEHGLRSEGVIIDGFSLRSASAGGENYCSDIYGALVRYRSKEDGNLDRHGNEQAGDGAEDEGSHMLHLIVKSMPAHKQGVLARLRIFSKEVFFYMDLKPKLEALMAHAIATPWKMGAELFYATVHPEQTLVFSDLQAAGFELRCRQEGLDGAHAVLVLRKLAQYHAATMVLMRQDPKRYIAKRYAFGLLNEPSIRAPPFQALFGAQLLQLIALLAADEDAICRQIAMKLRGYNENFVERIINAIQPQLGQWNVLNHGDVWVNNLFFRYAHNKSDTRDIEDKKNASYNHDQPEEVRFIDFQLCFYGSLGFDVNYFLNTSVQLDVLKLERCTLVNAYYESLVSTLRQLSPNNMPLPSHEDVLHELRQREAYGFFVAFGLFPLMSMERAHSMDNSLERLNDPTFASQKIQLMFKSNKRTYETLRYTVQRLNDLGVFD